MSRATSEAFQYQSGFGNQFASEARSGALPIGRNSPQQVPFGLYAELISGTAFTAPRAHNQRTWMYRLRPSAMQAKALPIEVPRWQTGPFTMAPTPANRLRWDPWPGPGPEADFIDGMFTVAGNGDASAHTGVAAHVYHAGRSMEDRYFVNSDGEMLLVPQEGRLLLHTELGRLAIEPGEIALVPRGLRWRVELLDSPLAATFAKTMALLFAFPSSGPSDQTALPIRVTFWRRPPRTKTGRRIR
jgi:homogentisate 1,2-dioxygenase